MFCYCGVVFGSREDLLFQLFQLKINLTCPKLTTHLIPEILPTSEIYWGGMNLLVIFVFCFCFLLQECFWPRFETERFSLQYTFMVRMKEELICKG